MFRPPNTSGCSDVHVYPPRPEEHRRGQTSTPNSNLLQLKFVFCIVSPMGFMGDMHSSLYYLAFLATSVSDLITNNDDTAKPKILMSDSCRAFTRVPCEPKFLFMSREPIVHIKVTNIRAGDVFFVVLSNGHVYTHHFVTFSSPPAAEHSKMSTRCRSYVY